MEFCFSLFNDPIGLVIISFYYTCVYIIAFVAETILFPLIPIIADFFHQSVMWRQFLSFKEFVRPRTNITSSSGNNIP